MAKVIVLGGCGAVGSNAVKTLVSEDTFSEVVIGDANFERAEQLVTDLGAQVSALKFDATSKQSCKEAMAGCDVVLNCVGPFYSTVKTILNRFHCMSINIPMFLDGELKYVKYFEEDGIALRQTFDFPLIGRDGETSLIIERVDTHGNVTTMDL